MGDTGEVMEAAVWTRPIHISQPGSKENQAPASTTASQSTSTELAGRHSWGGVEDYQLRAENYGLGTEPANVASTGSTSHHKDGM